MGIDSDANWRKSGTVPLLSANPYDQRDAEEQRYPDLGMPKDEPNQEVDEGTGIAVAATAIVAAT